LKNDIFKMIDFKGFFYYFKFGLGTIVFIAIFLFFSVRKFTT